MTSNLSAGQRAVKIVACLIWWDERPEFLTACLDGCAPFCDQIVAVDGAYSFVPGGTATSSPEQAAAIRAAAQRHGMTCSIHEPTEPWPGQEPQKRAFLFEAAEQVSRPWVDWWLSVDADEVPYLDCSPEEFRMRLATTELDVGQAAFGEYRYMRRLFRAIPGLRAVTNHEFATLDGRYTFGTDPDHWSDDERFGLQIDHTKHNEKTPERLRQLSVGYRMGERFNYYLADRSLPKGTDLQEQRVPENGWINPTRTT